jgi:CheY-like chemotaxis protein
MNSKPLNILFADDDKDDRFLFEQALKGIPLATHLTTVYDGEQLMKYLSEHSEELPDVLFLDLSMPRKSGMECLSEIKKDEKLKGLPVVLFSTSFSKDSKNEEVLKDHLSEIGAYDYIRKPADFEELKKAIHQELIKIKEKEIWNK